jgi:hypothetical protein
VGEEPWVEGLDVVRDKRAYVQRRKLCAPELTFGILSGRQARRRPGEQLTRVSLTIASRSAGE